MPSVKWNDKVKLIISDVDETVADLYVRAEPEMIAELTKLLEREIVLFLISGQSVQGIRKRIIDYVKPNLRKRIVVGHCSGAEVWGFDAEGNLSISPFYSLYDSVLTEVQKAQWREIIKQLIGGFKLEVYETGPILEFKKRTSNNPLAIMCDDRGPQITLEVVNGYDLSPQQASELAIKIPMRTGSNDLRIPLLERGEELLRQANLPIAPRLAGVFALDFAIKGVSKTTAVKYVMENEKILLSLGLTKEVLKDPSHLEVWGDKFSTIRGGTDRHISEALAKEVRSITFRKENPDELPAGYNIIIWAGKQHLQLGLLEFLKSR